MVAGIAAGTAVVTRSGAAAERADAGAIVRHYYAVVDDITAGRRSMSAFDDVVTQDFKANLAGQAPLARQGFEQVLRAFAAGFPRSTHTIEEIIHERDKAAVRIQWQGIHSGPFEGATPTGKVITMAEIEILRLSGARVAELWAVTDSLTLMKASGVVIPAR